MNDRFKFRIFDKIHNRFLCTDKQKRIIFDYENKEINVLENEENSCWLHIPFDECEILQCTGLKDKNGTLIYEGDIVRYTEYEIDDIEPEWEYTEIVWGENHDYPAFDLKTHNFDCNGLSEIFNCGYTIEVLGNIYENKKRIKELMDEQD